MNSPLEKPAGLTWNPTAVELPEVPLLPPGQDAMSMTIAGVLPTLAAPLTKNIAALSAKETMFSGKLGAAEAAYQNADDSGQQSVGQLTSMLGQVGQQAGQLGQSAGAPAQALGGQTGTFGSMMQQAMQAAQGGGSGGGGSQAGRQGGASPADGRPFAAQGSTGAGASQQPRDDALGDMGDQTSEQDDREARHDGDREDRPPVAEAAGPDDSRHGAGPAPVAPPEHPRHGDDDDLARRM